MGRLDAILSGNFRPRPAPTKVRGRAAGKLSRKPMPAWTAPVGGRLEQFRAFTKSEVRAQIKAMTGAPLAPGYGQFILRAGG